MAWSHSFASIHGGVLWMALVAGATVAWTLPAAGEQQEQVDLTKYVDPLIGSDGHGHVFVGANVPFGAVQVGPNHAYQGWDWCSGYHYSDDELIGFSHLHLSGTGCADLGDILLMPLAGEFDFSTADPAVPLSSRYSHRRETARAGYYAIELLDHDVHVELTATERVGVHRYTFPEGWPAWVLLDLHHGNGDDRATETGIGRLDDGSLVGRRFSTGWAKDQRVFFALQTSPTPDEVQWLDEAGQPVSDGDAACRAALRLPAGTRTVLVKVGLSPVSTDNALANVEAEVPHWNFETVRREAREKWNHALNAVRASTLDGAQMRVFYTALYHTMFAPVIFQDVNGEYRGADGQVHHAAEFVNYSVLSLWDTYRAAHPLLTITQPGRVDDFVNTMLAIEQQQGKLPVWHLLGNETDTMIGYHAVPVIADAYLKGHRGFDADQALEAMKSSALQDDRGLEEVKARGYIPADVEIESVAKGLEYAIDDWCITMMARQMGRSNDYRHFARRSQNYRHYFDADAGFMRGKLADGSWRVPFDPAASTHRRDDFCEGNAWQYTWLVPHDVEGLIALVGGAAAFNRKLDQLFTVDSALGEQASVDISGLIGQYAHGNEPGHHIPYLYSLAGKPGKTAARVRSIVDTLYTDRPDGLCGNEDCGQMSAWYVFSALGFYPVSPAGGTYVLGSPIVDEATIRLPGNKQFRIKTIGNSAENIYIQAANLNGQPLADHTLEHEQIMAGGQLVLTMGDAPPRTPPHKIPDADELSEAASR